MRATATANSIRKIIGFVALFLASSSSSFACQESCLIIATTKKSAVLEDFEGKALRDAEVIVRDATNGSDTRCGKFGLVAKRLRTDQAGHFKLNGLRAGNYWITYIDQHNGESFYIRLEEGKASGGRLELQLDRRDVLSGRCRTECHKTANRLA